MEPEGKKKNFLIKVTVISFTALVLILWVFNLKNIWRDSGEHVSKSTEDEWWQLREDLSGTLASLNNLGQKISTSSNLTTMVGNEMLSDVLSGAKELSSSSKETIIPGAVASSTSATSTLPGGSNDHSNASGTKEIKNKQCPEYINCMPTIGENRPCVIPAGCEGVTKIAY